jgi:hypothetical protein
MKIRHLIVFDPSLPLYFLPPPHFSQSSSGMYANHQVGFTGGYGAPGFDPSAGPIPAPRDVYPTSFPDGPGTTHSTGNSVIGSGIQGPGSGSGILGADVVSNSIGDGSETVEMSGNGSESLKRKFEEDVSLVNSTAN